MNNRPPVDASASSCAATTRLTIDLDALAANWRSMQKLSGQAACGAAVKADAYGTGLAPAGQRLWKEGCRSFFVADAYEGQKLRTHLPDAQIFVLNGAFPDALDLLRDAALVPVLNSPQQIHVWQQACRDRPAALHIDTGMNRLGIPFEEAAEIAAQNAFAPALVMSHFSCADTPGHPLNAEQIARFDAVRQLYPQAPASLGNSAGIHLGSAAHFDLTRPGIALYGGEAVDGEPNPMRPVMTFEARILMIRHVPAGECVSYGATARLQRTTRLAVCGAGYADGFPRAASGSGVPLRDSGTSGAFGAFKGHLVPLVGRVTMDLVIFDITDLPEDLAAAGDWIELFGPTVAVDDVARAAGTIGYEILACPRPRADIRYKEGGS
ncbi:alanine racemase [Pseudohoeflea coraliihabitans]|uniref:Alanine racemase n=1 Tax=Pseudohoeflea coraliihabitans TaxID=2860393 RepID=A0ABS6WPK7_9HYPH|nr:alanine racemase [Pseudohoeflea sp. DP4N28-3]MBW3097906.1 alanine racemase [Pseudohoeflea sp. DP4N28-3]